MLTPALLPVSSSARPRSPEDLQSGGRGLTYLRSLRQGKTSAIRMSNEPCLPRHCLDACFAAEAVQALATNVTLATIVCVRSLPCRARNSPGMGLRNEVL